MKIGAIVFALALLAPAALASEGSGNCSNGWDDDDDKLVDCDDPDCASDSSCLERGNCGNGLDDDGDGLVDCSDLSDCCGDPACAGAPGCPERACDDGIDDDGDGLVDCADPDCRRSGACVESAHCANGIDDDGDGRIDCADSECCSTTSCAGSPQCPERPCDDGLDNDSDGLTDCEDADCAPSCDESAHCADRADNDGDSLIDCDDDDCLGSPDCRESANCRDGEDNDADGLVDCDDPDCCSHCSGAPGCPEIVCDDGVDNDRDGLVDCADDDCLTAPACLESLHCADEADNDGDGLVDCDDPDCRCGTEISRCTNGRDDDHDGAVDCDDSDCCTDPACASSGRACQETQCSDGIDDDSDGFIDCDDYDCRRPPDCPCEFGHIDACRADHGVLPPPTEDCQYRAGRACAAAVPYEVELAPGLTYVFTFCPSTCPGASATFDAQIVLDGPRSTTISAPACGGPGELRFTPDPADGLATYCVRIGTTDPLHGGSHFVLGYRAECAPPGPLAITPLSGPASDPGCARHQRFDVRNVRAQALDWEWSVLPPSGGSASPASGVASSVDGRLAFESDLTGVGTYSVQVTAHAACGDSTRTLAYRLADRRGPSLTALAEDCDATTTARIAPPKSLGCASPCTSGIVVAPQDFFDVEVRCDDGAFAIRTGALHPATLAAGIAQDVTWNGAIARPGTSQVAWRLHDVGQTLLNPAGASACLFDPPDTTEEPASTGIAVEWHVAPATGLALALREEIVAFGTSEADAGVRITLEAVDDAASTRDVGVGMRWELDAKLADDDGPRIAATGCDPPTVMPDRATEHLFGDDELLDFLRLRNDGGAPMDLFVATSALDGVDGAFVPERVLYGDWHRLKDAAWGLAPVEGSPAPDADSALLLHAGWDASLAPRLHPGDSLRRSILLLASDSGRGCGLPVPGVATSASIETCEGDCVRIGAAARDACSTPSVTLVSSSPGAPPCTSIPCLLDPPPGTHVYEWEATDDAGLVTRATSTIVVRPAGSPGCNQPPACDAGLAYAAPCGRVTLHPTASDPDGDPLTPSWTTTCDAVALDASAWEPELVLSSECAGACSVTLTVTDPGGLSCTSSASVTPADDGPRLVGVPSDATAECDAVPPPAPVGAEDGCDPAPSLDFAETRIDGPCPGRFGLTRTWTARDRCGHEAVASQSIAVVDDVAPIVDRDDSVRACVWPPAHRMRCFDRGAFTPSVRDACSDPVTWRLVACESDQPDDGLGDGTTSRDCAVSDDGSRACVRAERQGGRPNGRRYRVLAVATDACGNASAPQVVGVIAVPHDADDFERTDCP